MKKYIAESLGTLLFVFFGVGSMMCLNINSGSALLFIALCFALSFIIASYLFQKLAPCHFNPAVSLAFLIKKKIDTKEFWFLLIAQFIGSLIAVGLLCLIGALNNLASNISAATISLNSSGDSLVDPLNIIFYFLFEILLSALFILGFLTAKLKKSSFKFPTLLIAACILFLVFVSFNYTRSIANPASYFAVSLIFNIFQGTWNNLSEIYIFIIAPFIGSVIAVLVFNKLLEKEEK